MGRGALALAAYSRASPETNEGREAQGTQSSSSAGSSTMVATSARKRLATSPSTRR